MFRIIFGLKLNFLTISSIYSNMATNNVSSSPDQFDANLMTGQEIIDIAKSLNFMSITTQTTIFVQRRSKPVSAGHASLDSEREWFGFLQMLLIDKIQCTIKYNPGCGHDGVEINLPIARTTFVCSDTWFTNNYPLFLRLRDLYSVFPETLSSSYELPPMNCRFSMKIDNRKDSIEFVITFGHFNYVVACNSSSGNYREQPAMSTTYIPEPTHLNSSQIAIIMEMAGKWKLQHCKLDNFDQNWTVLVTKSWNRKDQISGFINMQAALSRLNIKYTLRQNVVGCDIIIPSEGQDNFKPFDCFLQPLSK